MVESLLSSFGLAAKPIKQQQLVKTYRAVMSIVSEDVIPTLEEVAKVEKDKRITSSKILDLAIDIIKIKKGTYKDFIKNLHKFFTTVSGTRDKIESIIIKHSSTVITDKSMSVKDAAIIKLVDDISSMALYTMDLVTCVLADAGDTSFPKIKFKQLKEGLPSFAELYANYSKNFEKNLEAIVKLDDTVLTRDTNVAMVDAKLSKSNFTPPSPTGFINNPFYHIRMWLVDRDLRKLELLRDKKKLVELRLMELKLEARSGGDQDLTKQIEYYEEKLSSLEYDIQKLEEA